MAFSCVNLQSFLLRQQPQFSKELSRDMNPRDMVWSGFYPKATFESFRGTEITKDRIHVAMPNNAGCWDEINVTDCESNPCAPGYSVLGWGTSRTTYNLAYKQFRTPVVCFDQLRHVEQAVAKLSGIVQGLKKIPEYIVGDWTRTWIMRGANQLYIAGSANLTVESGDYTFSNDCRFLNLGSTANLPTSKLTVPVLDYWAPDLQLNGYFDGEFTPTGKYQVVTDMQTARDLANGNPALSGMYTSADFEKGGKYYQYGAMMGVGNYLLKIDPYPARFQRVGNSATLERVWPFDNLPATAGKKPVVSQTYKNACYQLSVVPSRKARTVYVSDTTPVNSEMKFASRSLFGNMRWHNPGKGLFKAVDPMTGTECTYDNTLENYGFFIMEFEAAVENEYPEREMAVLHLREPSIVVDDPRCVTCPAQQHIYPYPYSQGCQEE
jgi:hypothetical protein